MEKHVLPLYISEAAKRAVLTYNSMIADTDIGQVSGTHFKTSFSVDAVRRISRALIELGLLLPELGRYAAAILFEGVTLTRELKPATCSPLGRGVFCKFVYDVTPITSSRQTSTYSLEIEYRGIKEIKVAHVGMLALGEKEESLLHAAFYSGALSLEPGSEFGLTLPFAIESGVLRLILLAPHPSAEVLVEMDNGRRYVIKGNGFEEHRLELGQAGAFKRLMFKHQGPGSYYPRSILVSSVLAYSMRLPRPEIKAELKSVRGKEARITISNEGDAEAQKIIVVSVSKGMITERKELDRLAPGSTIEVKLRVNSEHPSIIRVIWKEFDNIRFEELRIKRRPGP